MLSSVSALTNLRRGMAKKVILPDYLCSTTYIAYRVKKSRSRTGFVTPYAPFEDRANAQNVSDGVTNPVAIRECAIGFGHRIAG